MNVARWRLRHYLAAERRRIGLATLAMAGRAGVLVLLPWPLKFVINCVILGKRPPHWLRKALPVLAAHPLLLLNVLAATMLLLAVADSLLDWLGNRLFLAAGQRSVRALRQDVFDHLVRLPLAFHRRRRRGELMSRLVEDIGRVQDMIVIAGTGLTPHLFTLLGIVVVMVLIDWRYALLAMATLPAFAFVSHRWAGLLRTRLRRARAEDGELWGMAQEVLGTVPLVQASGRERHEQHRFARRAVRSLRAALAVSATQAQIAPLVNLLIGAGAAVITWYGALRVLAGSLTPGDLLLFLAYLRGMVTPVRQIAKAAPQLGRAAVALERIRELFAEPIAVADPPVPVRPSVCAGRLEFHGVGFDYIAGVPALRDISFALAPGRRVALVGPTGAGKTTIAALAVRLLDPITGGVLLDGCDLRNLPLSYVRRQITLMLQDAPLLHGTVWENIAYGRAGAGRADAIRAAAAAGVDEVIADLPQGYDTRVAEHGASLSGGQRQCLAVARATLAGARVLILDEPSASLDPLTERRIAAALVRLSAERASLVIAHRLATIRDADLILVVEHGCIVQRGTHRSLLQEGGLYAQLLRGQPADAVPTVAAE